MVNNKFENREENTVSKDAEAMDAFQTESVEEVELSGAKSKEMLYEDLEDEPEEWFDDLEDKEKPKLESVDEDNGVISKSKHLQEEDIEIEMLKPQKSVLSLTLDEYLTKHNITFDDIEPSEAEQTQRTGFEAGVWTLINSKRNGKRSVHSADLIESLGNPESLQFSYIPGKVLIGENLKGVDRRFKLKKYGKKFVIYAASLVEEITKKLDLDYSDRVSITFTDVEYIENNGTVIAVIGR